MPSCAYDQAGHEPVKSSTVGALTAGDGLRSIVVGAGTSGHDVAAQLWEAGSEVTMIQRSLTIVMRMDLPLPAVDIFNTDAPGPKPSADFSDLLAASIPNRPMAQFQIPLVEAVKVKEKNFYEGLQKAVFLYDFIACWR
jgi:putative flavoprotein involved in K+ transport